jgi:SAM-dependent methyltransferase
LGQVTDNWAQGHAYERYMGRWSRQVASAFVGWLSSPPGMRWLDVGCGTGALTAAILRSAGPDLVVACDPAGPFIEFARNSFDDSRASFAVAGIEDLPQIEGGYDAIVSGLVLNFLPAPAEAMRSMIERVRPDGLIAAYVWDYAGRMDFLRIFWEEAVSLDPGAKDLDEGRRFPLGQADMLMELFANSGLSGVRQKGIEIRTRFANFADFWAPFEDGTGPAPGYVASLAPEHRARLQHRLRQRLTPKGDSPIEMVARAWAVSGRRG